MNQKLVLLRTLSLEETDKALSADVVENETEQIIRTDDKTLGNQCK